MKTRCPDCKTIFRISSEQLKARAGQVRCGHCQAVFNALDNLLEEQQHPVPASMPASTVVTHAELVSVDTRSRPEISETAREPHFSSPKNEPEMWDPEESERTPDYETPPVPVEIQAETQAETQEKGKAAGLILPRETTEIPGYSKWAEGVMAPPIGISAEKPSHWPFKLTAIGLALALAGQALFHFRGELAVSLPSLRPALETFSLALGDSLPLPRHVEQVSIETSDLQTDTARGNLLVLNATLRNKAPYGQAYPSLEFSLTDTQDTVIARRVFTPQDYLPAKTIAVPVFSGNSDIAVRLWIEAVNLSAAGYRLFVYYP
jgi:predicted Zn finger-like uncharacterized protein